ncbi:hypothetical protein N7455_008711 [Penicillium solitum]|uniref:uncharacterized protein n=1 Tax=Penicillium solitum TaxID=60172 RepID=UPI001852C978|nr:hypothetical protein HAV15_008474 [Penicillium sp. str. \
MPPNHERTSHGLSQHGGSDCEMLGRGLVMTFTSLMLQFHPRNFHTPGRLSVTPCCSLELFAISYILEPAIEDIDTARASVAQNIHKDRSLPMALSKLRSKSTYWN